MRASAGRVADPRLFVNCSLHGSPAPGEARRASWPAYLPTPRDRNRPNSRYGNVFFLFFFSWLIRKKKKKRKLRSRFEKKGIWSAMTPRNVVQWLVITWFACSISISAESRLAFINDQRIFLAASFFWTRNWEREKEKKRRERKGTIEPLTLFLCLCSSRGNALIFSIFPRADKHTLGNETDSTRGLTRLRYIRLISML